MNTNNIFQPTTSLYIKKKSHCLTKKRKKSRRVLSDGVTKLMIQQTIQEYKFQEVHHTNNFHYVTLLNQHVIW